MQHGNLTLVRGDDQTVAITVTNPDNSPYDLSGCAITFLARQSQNYFSDSLFAVQTTQHISNISGISQLFFSGSITSGLNDSPRFYDIKLTSSLGLVTTLVYGTFQLAPS